MIGTRVMLQVAYRAVRVDCEGALQVAVCRLLSVAILSFRKPSLFCVCVFSFFMFLFLCVFVVFVCFF